MADDKGIIVAIRENPERGFRLLMASYKEPVYWHIRRLVVNHADAQDAAQEAFVRIFRNFQQYNEANSLKVWIFRIATNEALRLLGKLKNSTMLSLDEVTADMLGTKTDGHFDSSDAITMKLQQAILHHLPGMPHAVLHWPVDEQQVDIVHIQLTETLIDGVDDGLFALSHDI